MDTLTQKATEESPILIYWWADNFNQTLDSATGSVINSTHLAQFSESLDDVSSKTLSLNISRNGVDH